MSDHPKLTWEVIEPFHRLERIRLPEGWLYRTVQQGAVALCFVPDVTETLKLMPPAAPHKEP
jgi:hypothetical protein